MQQISFRITAKRNKGQEFLNVLQCARTFMSLVTLQKEFLIESIIAGMEILYIKFIINTFLKSCSLECIIPSQVLTFSAWWPVSSFAHIPLWTDKHPCKH